jgi:uncharacterized oligopeptide transporter (OPT) family protein
MSEAPAAIDPSSTATEPPFDAPAPPDRPSARSLVVGFLLAMVLCGVNSYLTLSFGVIEEGPTIAALFFFAFFFLSRTKIIPAEMVMVATMGSAGGSLGFISNFFAAKAMTGEPYTFFQMAGFSVVTSLVGMAFTIPLREMLILREDLPWPGSRATASVIKALVSSSDKTQPLILLVTCALGIAFVVLNDDGGFGLIPAETALPLFGLAAFGAGIAWSPFAIGGAYLMGLRTCVGFLFGAIVLLIMAPHLPQPEAPHRYVWPGIGFLLASGLTTMAINWRVTRDSFAGLVRRGDGGVEDDDPILSPRAFMIFTAIAITVTAVFSSVFMGLSVIAVVLLVVVGGLIQNVIATRAAAQTAFNPARVMGVLLQGITAASGASNAGANLAGAGFVAGSGAQAGNLTGDLVYGRWLRVPSRWQWWAQMTTILPCSLVSAWVFTSLQASQPMTLDGEGLPAPVAKMWAATALVFEGTLEMPPFAGQALAIGAAAGAIYVLLERQKSLEPWLPSSIGLGIGLVLPISFDLAFFVGGVLLFLVGERALKIPAVSLTTIAVGCIVAEGLGGVLKPLLAIVGVL